MSEANNATLEGLVEGPSGLTLNINITISDPEGGADSIAKDLTSLFDTYIGELENASVESVTVTRRVLSLSDGYEDLVDQLRANLNQL